MQFSDIVYRNELWFRLGCFAGILIIMFILELVIPSRRLMLAKGLRWRNNLSLVGLNSFILKLIFPAGAVGVALWCSKAHIGLLNYWNNSGSFILLIAGLIILDGAIYWQHRIFHSVTWLWRLHQVHHADLDYDVTTGLRFHPLEIILSMLIKFAVIVLVGISPLAVILFEVILNGMAMFNHGNIKLPTAVDRFLRWMIVTPDMHRIHHSVIERELNRNFGFNLSCWDRIFASYQHKPQGGYWEMTIGLSYVRDSKLTQRLSGILKMPFMQFRR